MIEYCESGMSRVPFKDRDPKLYYYELRSDDEGNGYTIERRVIVNNIGCLVTTEDILDDNDYIDGDRFESMDIFYNPDLIKHKED